MGIAGGVMVVICVSVFLQTSVVLVSGVVDLMISLGKEINVVCTFNVQDMEEILVVLEVYVVLLGG